MGIITPNPWEGLTEEQKKQRSENISKKVSGSNNGSYGSKFYYNLITKEKRRFKHNDIIPDGWVCSIDYFESKKRPIGIMTGPKVIC